MLPAILPATLSACAADSTSVRSFRSCLLAGLAMLCGCVLNVSIEDGSKEEIRGEIGAQQLVCLMSNAWYAHSCAMEVKRNRQLLRLAKKV